MRRKERAELAGKLEVKMGAEIVKKEFELFLAKHVPEEASLDVDDVVLDYIVQVLSELAEGAMETSFDVEEFSEMVSAYVPEFSSVDSSVVYQWMFELADKQKLQTEVLTAPAVNVVTSTSPITINTSNHKPTAVTPNELSKLHPHSQSQTNDTPTSSTHTLLFPPPSITDQVPTKENATIYDKEIQALKEMFPDFPEKKLFDKLSKYGGNVEETVQDLLTLTEDSEKLSEATKHTKEVECKTSMEKVCEDKSIKESVLARYAFVDADEDKITHRPMMAKSEPKKMVRYRDGHVVSTKGERFTILTHKETEGEEMKKTYINLNPLRKYRFH